MAVRTSGNSKNIVLALDGTSNEIIGDSSNILRLFRCLKNDSSQMVYYDTGVGTHNDSQKITKGAENAFKSFDYMTGFSVRNQVLRAYRHLVEHYEDGDKIYLFGFSRGAYSARALAGMIDCLGLLRKDLIHLADKGWDVYATDDPQGNPNWKGMHTFYLSFSRDKDKNGRSIGCTPLEQSENKAFDIYEDFNARKIDLKKFDENKGIRYNQTMIHFMGVFDTVATFGYILNLETLPYTANNRSIRHIRHAVAKNERRNMFRLNHFGTNQQKMLPEGGSIKEVLFKGTHSDVGGGYPEKDSALAKSSLQWMLNEAYENGIHLEKNMVKYFMGELNGDSRTNINQTKPNYEAEGNDSLTLKYWWMEFLPRRYENNFKLDAPNFGRERQFDEDRYKSFANLVAEGLEYKLVADGILSSTVF